MEKTSQRRTVEDIISDALLIQVFSYNSVVTGQVWGVIKLLGEATEVDASIYNSEIAEKLCITPEHAELIQYLICNNDYAEYGTSPRGCWLTDKGFTLYKQLKEACEEEKK